MVRASKTVSVVFLLAVGVASAADDAYHRQIEQDRRETDEFLRSEKSPLLLIGRFSVNEGSSTLGSDPASTIVLPTRAPQHLGTIFRHGNQFTFEVMMGTSVSLNGKPASGPSGSKWRTSRNKLIALASAISSSGFVRLVIASICCSAILRARS